MLLQLGIAAIEDDSLIETEMKKARDQIRAGVQSYFVQSTKTYEQLDAEATPSPGLREKSLGVMP